MSLFKYIVFKPSIGFSSKFKKGKFYDVANRFFKLYNKARFHKIDSLNLSSRFSSFIFKELVMLFFF